MRSEEQKKKHTEYMREYRRDNSDKINAQVRQRRKDNIERYREYDRKRYAKDPLGRKLERYKISKEQYLQMELDQNNKCSICEKEMNVVNIDHCHETEEVRGLLCTACNTGIGKLKDDINILESAIKYLSSFK